MGLILVGLVIILGFFVFLIFPGKLSNRDDQVLWASDYAHRGLHQSDGSIVENSLTAFQEAVSQGYGIELDLQLSKDKKVVVFHDDNLLRVCGIDKKINECTYAQLKTYPLGQTGDRIPLFTEVLDLVKGRSPLLVELKNVVRWQDLCEQTAALLSAYSGAYLIESFHPGIVRWFYKNKPSIVRGQLSAATKNFAGIPKWQGFLIASLMTNVSCRPHFVAYKIEDLKQSLSLRLFGFLSGKILTWTIREQEIIEAEKINFDAIIFEFMRPEHKNRNFRK